MSTKRALITGITGQDGSYLCELLLAQGYEVHGIVRRSSSLNTGRIDHLYQDRHEEEVRLFLHYGDMLDSARLQRVLQEVRPHEVYNLAAQSHVRLSFDQPDYTTRVNALGTLNLLDAFKHCAGAIPDGSRFYQAGSSEMFGNAPAPQSEASPFQPQSPYAVSKVAAHHFGVHYREAYGLFVCNGILFNHESERRGETFVTRKVTLGLARIKLGLQRTLFLGNLDAKRDWGFAGDYVRAMWQMLQHDQPGDFVVATGTSHSVRDLLDTVAARLDMDWHDKVEIDPRYFRPSEVDVLQGDASLARDTLGWSPEYDFTRLVHQMTDADLARAEREARTS